MQRVLAVVIALLLAGGAAGVATIDGDAASSRPALGPVAPPSTTPTTTTLPPLTAGVARVTGTVTAMTATGARGEAVRLPLTFTMPNPGGGRVHIPSVEVGGERQAIEWNGGRPLPVTGTGAIEIDDTTVQVDANGINWSVDGAPRFFAPGTYALGSSVAVGGAARDQVTFRAGDGDGFESTGGVRATATPRPLRIEGPSGTLQLAGALTVETRTVSRPLPTLHFGPGTYVVEITPEGGGYRIVATLEGPFGA